MKTDRLVNGTSRNSSSIETSPPPNPEMLNLNPTPRQLRQFAFAGLLLMPLLAWLLCGRPVGESWLPWHTGLIGGLTALGSAFVVLAYAAPRVLKPVFVATSLLALPIGFVIGEVVLAAVYFGVFTPLAIVFRLMGRDPLERQIDRGAASYWRKKPQPRDVASYFRQS